MVPHDRVTHVDWNKHGAIAGYGAWVFAAASIGVALWLGMRQPVIQPDGGGVTTPAVPSWAFWLTPTIYGVFVLVAALFHFASRRHTDPDLRAELNSARAEAEAARLRITTQAHEITDGQRKFERTEADLVKARAELYSLRGELRARKEQEAAESNEREALAEKLRSAPKLWVEYKPKEMTDPLGTEFFVFDKEGTAAIKNIQAGPLTWTIQKAYPIAFLSALGPLREQPVECRISVSELIDGNTQLHQVSQLVRKMAKEHGQTLQPYVDFSYEDFDGNRFLQRFVLSIDSYEKIVLEPTGPVTFRNAAPERDLQTGA